MKTYLLQALRGFTDGGIPKRYIIQVISTRTGTQPDVTEVIEVLRRAESWLLRVIGLSSK